MSFSELGISKWLLKTLDDCKILSPTEVQKACIKPTLEGRDILACSKTGSGKTASFALPILERLAEDPYGVFAIVLTPTRELASQIADQFKLFGTNMNVRVELVTGGMDQNKQTLMLSEKPHVIVATPGRLAELLSSTNLRLNKVKFFVMDEADRLLDTEDGDFGEDLTKIVEKLPENRQTLMYSATLSQTIQQAQAQASKEPFFWQAEELDDAVDSNVVVMPETLEQKYVLVPEDIRDPYLVHMVKLLLEDKMAGNEQLIIFSKTCKSVQVLGMMLQKIGARAVVLHSILKQSQRFAALEQFKSSKARVLVATDVASRGLDLPHVSIVINHNVPGAPKNYVHRVGRTARAGKKGTSITMMSPYDTERVKEIEKMVDCKMTEYPLEEDKIVKILTQVQVMKREAELQLEKNKFGEKRRINRLKDDKLQEKIELAKKRRFEAKRLKKEDSIKRNAKRNARKQQTAEKS